MGDGPWARAEAARYITKRERARCRRLVKRELKKVEEADPNKYGASEAEQAFHRILEGLSHDGVSRTKNSRPKREVGVHSNLQGKD